MGGQGDGLLEGLDGAAAEVDLPALRPSTVTVAASSVGLKTRTSSAPPSRFRAATSAADDRQVPAVAGDGAAPAPVATCRGTKASSTSA